MVLLDLPSQALVLLKYNGHLGIVIVLKLLHPFPQCPHLQAFTCIRLTLTNEIGGSNTARISPVWELSRRYSAERTKHVIDTVWLQRQMHHVLRFSNPARLEESFDVWCKITLMHYAQQAVLACAARACLAHNCSALTTALFLVHRLLMHTVTPTASAHEGKIPNTALASAVLYLWEMYSATDITKATSSQIQHIPWPRFQQFWLVRQHSLPQWPPSP